MMNESHFKHDWKEKQIQIWSLHILLYKSDCLLLSAPLYLSADESNAWSLRNFEFIMRTFHPQKLSGLRVFWMNLWKKKSTKCWIHSELLLLVILFRINESLEQFVLHWTFSLWASNVGLISSPHPPSLSPLSLILTLNKDSKVIC